MQAVNTEVFFSVTLSSGLDDRSLRIARTYEEAVDIAEKHDALMKHNFERWLEGDSQADVMIDSAIEPDGEGGCSQVFSIHPACLSGSIMKHEVGSATQSAWKNVKGADKIVWGNPATARPCIKKTYKVTQKNSW